MANHDDMPTRLPALVWAVIFTILLVAAVPHAHDLVPGNYWFIEIGAAF
jgi:hypothetical protein